ncbi:unnamed protein product [Urochloa decumbens]|uniref:Uncharacterized protein n=1 Tax=Urochloa decumbens TaxID=240449 RepID=A0ABC8Z5V2_9POAL
MAANTSSSFCSRCDACGENVGLWHAAFTSECAHTFHLRCVSGIASCPSCAAPWKDAPAAAPAPTPATPFSFASTAGLFGHTSAAAANSSSSAATMTGAFGFGQRPQAATSSIFSGAQATASVFNFSGSQATSSPFSISLGGQATPPPPPRSQPSGPGRSLFGVQAAPPAATPNPFWLGSSPPASQSPPPSCCVCGGAMSGGQATVTSECAHTFHLRCFSGSVCPVCGARWRDEVTVTPSPPLVTPSSPTVTLPSSASSFSWPADITFEPPKPKTDPFSSCFPDPSSSPKFVAPSATPSFATPDPSASPSLFSFSRPAGFNFAPPNPSSTPAFGTLSSQPILGTPNSSSPPPQLSSSSPAFNYTRGRPDPWSSSSLFSGPPIFRVTPSNSSATPPPPSSSTTFHDDEPVDPPANDDAGQGASQQETGALVALTTHCETPAVARDAAHDGFAVLVHARAPAAAASSRAALDLVTVLDVSGSMEGTKLALVKQAMGFVIDNLGPRDRLSIVTFSDNARRIIRLTRMSGGGKALARAAMESVAAYGLTSIGDGLRVAAGVLASRRHRNPAAGIILLSDGVDNQTPCGRGPDGRKMHRDLVPSGRYESTVGSDGRAASVHVGEMYADEERRFLLFLDVPVFAGDSAGGVTRLIRASCTYRDAATGKAAEVAAGEEAAVERPVVVAAAGTAPSVEVARERFRVEAAEDIAAARAAAERGEHAEAARILDRRREASAAAGLAGDARCAALVAELSELGARVADRREYEQTGRAFALAGITAHAQQRASTVQFTGTAAPAPSPSLFGASAAPSRSFFGAGTAAAAAPSPSLFGAAPAFAASTTPAFGAAATAFAASTTPAFGQTAAPAFGAAPSSFSFGFATPAMQGMVESSRKTRESAPRTSFSNTNIGFSSS